MNEVNNKIQKEYKKTGLIRWNAIIPFFLVIGLMSLYFKLFFDQHMKSGLEWAGYKALGSEVNLLEFNSSFIQGFVQLKKLEITSAEKPDFNSLEIGSIKFDVSWDALLRLKFLIEEMSVENIQFMSKRSYRGKVAPPEPPSNEPSFVSELQEKALGKVADQGKNNLLGDLTAFLQTGNYKDQLKNVEAKIKSKELANDYQKKWEAKQIEWDNRIKALPTESDFKKYKAQFESIKIKDFKSPQELDASVKQFNALKAEVDGKIKLVNETKKQFNDDLALIKTDYANLDAQIKADIEAIKNHMKLPRLDAEQIAKSIFMDYLNPYLLKLNKINELASKYLPPKYSKMVNEKLDPQALLAGKKKATSENKDDDTIQPLPRSEGVSYEFPIKNGYPLFWIQKIKISSKSTAQADYGDLSGLIQNVVSNQRQIGQQTEIKINGDFKSKNIMGLKIDGYLNNLSDEPRAGFDFALASYPLQNIDLIKNNDGSISIPSANLGLNAQVSTVGFNEYNLNLVNNFYNVNFNLTAKEKIVEEILKNSFSQLQSFDLQANIRGQLKNLDVHVKSSLGEKLQDALSASIQKKIDEINLEIKAKIDGEIAKVKTDIEKQISSLTKGYLTSTDNIQGQLNAQKNIADEKIAQAKKDLENKAKNQLKDQGKKALEDLKKKIKF